MSEMSVAVSLSSTTSAPTTTSAAAATTTTTVGLSSDTSLSTQLIRQDISDIICKCGSCSFSSFLQNGCRLPSQIPALSLPYLEVSHLDKTQRQILLGRLYLEYKITLAKFSKLKRDIHHSISSERKLSFGTLCSIVVKLDSFMPSLPQHEKTSQVKKAKTVYKILAMLPEESSFLEYHVLEDLVDKLSDNDKLKEQVCSYKKDLEAYCKRGIFECPCYSPSSKPNHSTLIVEMHGSHCSMSIVELVSIQEQLCGLLSIVSNTLHPCTVAKMESGNIQIIFRIPDFVKEVLLPLSEDLQSALRQIGLLDLNFYNGLEISYDPTQLANQLLSSDTSSINHEDLGASNLATTDGGQRGDDISSDEDEDDDSLPRKKMKPAPGKKTRGRVKIPMEYIRNKLRRYTTFSKRKSNIMKKAYELSTLTGTQVMLMVASETGHVYTFATPKLQPMITSEAGKALIQTCLHQPDPAPLSMDSEALEKVRMSSSGYEEPDLGRYLPGSEEGRDRSLPPSSSLLTPPPPSSSLLTQPPPSSSSTSTSSVNHGMPTMYNPPPPTLHPSLSSELLPGGILQSLVTSSPATHSFLPPPLISPERYSQNNGEEDGVEHRNSPGS